MPDALVAAKAYRMLIKSDMGEFAGPPSSPPRSTDWMKASVTLGLVGVAWFSMQKATRTAIPSTIGEASGESTLRQVDDQVTLIAVVDMFHLSPTVSCRTFPPPG